MKLKDIIDKIQKYNPKANVDIVKRAYEYAEKYHEKEKRVSGEPYIIHPLNTAYILAELNMDVNTIAAALLHDVVEDTQVSIDKIKENFGEEVAMLVEGVTNMSRLNFKTREDYDSENVRKILLATVKDIRVIFIKLADKLHNMRTLKYLDEERRKRISQNTLDVYAPLAYRLGIWNLKWELEDLSFKYLEPDLYKKFSDKFGRTLHREIEVKKIKKIIEAELKKRNIPAVVKGRSKHFYSIYKKMVAKNRSFDEIYDLIGLRIITNDIKNCYEILGIIHNLWKPIPGEFDDYIAIPKANLYQSLHTAVLGEDGKPIEFQIRTEEMDKVADYGVAAHWEYKGVKGDKETDKKLNWLQQILNWQKESEDTKDFMEYLKLDFFSDEIYVFTPKGKVVTLPKGSTPIDFAYEVHTDVGHRCVGAIVNGRITPLRYKLKNGDIIQVLTSNNAKPKRDWLKMVTTQKAKNKIRQFIRAYEEIPIGNFLQKTPVKRKSDHELFEVDKKIQNPVFEIKKCCHPLPGDELVGYLTKTNRIPVHKTDCISLNKVPSVRKKIKVLWKEDINFPVQLKIIGIDRVGLFADILNTIASTGTNVSAAKIKLIGNGMGECSLLITPEDTDHLKDIIRRIKRVQDIKLVYMENP